MLCHEQVGFLRFPSPPTSQIHTVTIRMVTNKGPLVNYQFCAKLHTWLSLYFSTKAGYRLLQE